MSFMDLEKVFYRVSREALRQVLRIYNVGGKLLCDIKSVYFDNVGCVLGSIVM